ncbi:MAG: VanZ family protein [Chryseolinea sp.]
MKIVIRSFIPAVLAFIGATILFCLPGDEFPKEDWFELVSLDKLIHIGLFTTLVSLWCLPFIPIKNDSSKLKTLFVVIALAFSLYGVAIEFIQDNFVSNRTFGVDDMVADAIGSFIGLLVANWQLKTQLK